MISQKDRLLFKKKIISARALLMRNNPFFALLLMHMRYVAVPGMEQISTNGETIFFSPESMKKYKQNEVCSLLCHQVLHILMGDIWRPITAKGDEFHYERDLVVNAELKACGVGDYYVYVRSIPDKEIYDEKWGFVTDKITHRHMVDTDEFWSYELYDVENGIVILEAADDIWAQYKEHTHAKSFPPTTSAKLGTSGDGGGDGNDDRDENDNDGSDNNNQLQIKKETGKASSKAIQQKYEAKSNSKRGNHSQLKGVWAKLAQQYCKQGNVPLSIKRSFMNTGKGRLDWKKLLSDFIQEETFDYSFCPPDKRSDDIDFFLPDYNEKEYVVQDVLFMVDTSGSISEWDLNEAYAEIRHAIDLFNGNLRGLLGFCDADVTEPLPFSSAGDVAKITPYGGGGTDFRPIFDYMARHYSDKLPACLIIYTDGEGTYPSKKATLGVPVLWLINNNYVTPPFGKVARVGCGYCDNE